ncbi:hypothetical protein KSS87_004999 [Heliosperma pusillum]|nr:hypothetical protein KSS87_004999 [Heliosperma pusillum]
MVCYDESGNVWPIRKWVGFPLKCLKTLELVGYVGQPIDLELAFFVLENASMLEEVIVDFFLPHHPKRIDKKKKELLVMLQSKLPQGIKLTVKYNDDEFINKICRTSGDHLSTSCIACFRLMRASSLHETLICASNGGNALSSSDDNQEVGLSWKNVVDVSDSFGLNYR